MKTLPKVPKSIPARILNEAKAAGMIYVGVGADHPKNRPFGDRQEYCGRCEPKFGHLEFDHWSGSSSYAHYFATPDVAAKYFTLPKKTTQVLTRDARGRFRGAKFALDEANAKRFDEEKPMVGQVWIDNDNGMPYLIARVALEKVYLFSLRDGNRYYNDPRGERGLKLCPCFAFAANSPAEYFKNKS